MIFFDIITLAVLVWMIISGIKNGLVAQLFSIAGIAIGIALAIAAGESLGFALSIPPRFAAVSGFLIIFVTVIIITFIVGKLISKILTKAGLGWANRLTGAFFASLKGLVVLGLLYTAIFSLNNTFRVVEAERFDSSASFNVVRKIAQPLLNYWGASRDITPSEEA